MQNLSLVMEPKNLAFGCMPIAFSCIGIPDGVSMVKDEFSKHCISDADLFPLFPDIHANPSSQPFIDVSQQIIEVHIGDNIYAIACCITLSIAVGIPNFFIFPYNNKKF